VRVPHASPFSREASFINASKVERDKQRETVTEAETEGDRHRQTQPQTTDTDLNGIEKALVFLFSPIP
jgi:hypothetical protein